MIFFPAQTSEGLQRVALLPNHLSFSKGASLLPRFLLERPLERIKRAPSVAGGLSEPRRRDVAGSCSWAHDALLLHSLGDGSLLGGKGGRIPKVQPCAREYQDITSYAQKFALLSA